MLARLRCHSTVAADGEYGMLPPHEPPCRQTGAGNGWRFIFGGFEKNDCEIQADGGLISTPIMGGVINTDQLAALSCGIYQGLPVADLDYDEDSVADTDGNFVITGSGKLVEIQATAEGAAFEEAEFQTLMALAKNGISELVALQKQTVGL